MRRKPSRTPAPHTPHSEEARPGSPPTRDGASLFPGLVPLDEKSARVWMKDFETWLRLLRRFFYDWREGYLGPEGDPIRPNPEAAPWWEPSAGNCALADASRTITDLELGYDGFRAAGSAVKRSGPPVQLPLL